MDSGAIHLMGNRETEAAQRRERVEINQRIPPPFFEERVSHFERQSIQLPLTLCVSVRTFVVLLIIDVARQTEVTELDAFRRFHQDISHGYISTAQTQNRNTIKECCISFP